MLLDSFVQVSLVRFWSLIYVYKFNQDHVIHRITGKVRSLYLWEVLVKPILLWFETKSIPFYFVFFQILVRKG
jgi:hypothetical protein